MKRVGELYGKMIFWIENFFYIVLFSFYELFILPILYLKVSLILLKASYKNLLLLFFIWLPFGSILLLYLVMKDLFYFMKSLCDYKDENDVKVEKELEDEK